MTMCEKMKDNFYNWLGMKLYNKSEQFRNIIFGIYYADTQIPHLEKINSLVNENILLKNKLNAFMNPEPTQVDEIVDVPKKKKRKYTKRKKEVK